MIVLVMHNAAAETSSPIRSQVLRDWASRLGPVGVWTFGLDPLPVREAVETAQRIELLGFPSLWVAEGAGSRDAFVHSALLLQATERLVIGTGIANLWARDAVSMRSSARALSDAFPNRFMLGVGVSHAGAVARRGHAYSDRPLSLMRDYLEQMDAADAELKSPAPPNEAPRLIAALRSKMLGLASTMSDGAHTYFVPVEHTRRARTILGPGPLLVTELAVVVDADPTTARGTARRHTEHYLARDNYRNNLLWLGYGEDEMVGGGSDRLVDDLVAWGTAESIAARIHEHRHAGADHVVIQVVGGDVHGSLSSVADLTVHSTH